MNTVIENATMRKVLNRGFIPIRYRDKDQYLHGWIVEKTDKYWRVQFIGEEGVRRLRPMDYKWVVVLGTDSKLLEAKSV